MKVLGEKHILLKRNNGITLIALIVTIIVLLIIVGIGVSTLKGDNGIIKKTASTKKDSRDAEIEEEVYFDVSASKINKDAEVDENKLRNWLTKSFGEEGIGFVLKGDRTEGWTITIIENKSSYFVDSEGELEKTEYEEPIDNSDSLVLGFVDDLGTRAMIYLYANPDKCTAGETVTITDSQGNTLTNIDGEEQTTVKAVAKNVEGKLKITGTSYANTKPYYLAYPVTENGIYIFKSIKTGESEPTTTKIRVKNIETFTAIETLASEESLNYAGGDTKAYNYKGAAIPKGYYVDTKTDVDIGLVITDSVNSQWYSTGNEWVWVPVVENNDYKFHLVVEPAETMYGATSITYTNYSKLWKFTADTNGTIIGDLETTQAKPNSNSGRREPALIVGDNTQYDVANYTNIYNRNSSPKAKFNANNLETVSDLATQFRDDYDNMVKSVNTYGGFYIGRYEITVNGEKPGVSLTNKTWYELYNECIFLNKGTNTETSMIYGTLWDATMKWLADKKYTVGQGSTTSKYGCYNPEAVTVSNFDNTTSIIVKNSSSNKKLGTGQTSYTKSNNIYDLSGNCQDWTQEAHSYYGRVMRGGIYNSTSYYDTYSAHRTMHRPTDSSVIYSSRAQLYIK